MIIDSILAPIRFQTVLSWGLVFLQTDPSFEVRIMDDSVQC